MDLDGDGRVDFHEFYVAVSNYKALFTNDNLQNLFKIFDPTRRGTLT